MFSDTLKQIEFWVIGSGNGHYDGLLIYGAKEKRFHGEYDGTADQNLLTGVMTGLKMLKEPCRVRIVSSTSTGIAKPRKGRNQELKQAAASQLRKAGHDVTFDCKVGEGELVKARVLGVREPAHRTDLNPKRTEADWKRDHYQYALPNGDDTWIPNGWEVGGPGDEQAPF